jgi:uncharacterized membrane protein
VKTRSIPALLALVVALCTVEAAAQDDIKSKEKSESKDKKELSFAKDISPVLEKFCAGCHNAEEEHPSELYMESYESLMKGGKHGAPIKPGKSDESLLMQKMGKEPPFGKVMPPPRKKTPTPEQVQLIRAWIDQGAKKN